MPRFDVSFRIMGDELDPDWVSRVLKLKPTEAHRKGDARIAPAGRNYSPFSEGLWCLNSKAKESAPLGEHLEGLLRELSPRKKDLSALRKKGFHQDIFIGVFSKDGNSEFAIPLEMLKRLQELELEVDFDIYAS